MNYLWLLLLAVCLISCGSPASSDVLVFTATRGYVHASTEAGVTALEELGRREGFVVEATDDPSAISEDNLRRFRAVVFLNTMGDVLDYPAETDLERFIQAGGGFVGIHSAVDTEPDWPWYGQLVGARYDGHPAVPSNVQAAVLHVVDGAQRATAGLPDEWHRTDEWPNFVDVAPDLTVLLTVDESTYEGGANGEGHPVAWYHAFDGGRAFYTAGGHTADSFSEPEFLTHLLGGLRYAIGDAAPDYARARTKRLPEERRFERTVLVSNLDEPTEIEILPDGRILFAERGGKLKLIDPVSKQISVVAELEVNTTFEDGLIGLALDPNYAQNHWIYLYYSKPGSEPLQQLSRFVFDGMTFDRASEIEMLQVRVQRQECCHTGGSIEFGPDGHLFLSTGDNTNPFQSDGYAPIDERPGRHPFDAQAGPGNTNDLRGKILRITPQPDGTYAIPDGNLFPKDDPLARPEIYIMGDRNPYRIAIDQKTGYLYWGEVGPDANEDDPMRGPRGHDEINQARQAGFYGWPYFIGDNKPYRDYNFITGKSGDFFDPMGVINDSPNNTGRRQLPPAQKAFIWYPYADSPEFPIVGNGGRTAMAGPVFYSDAYRQGEGTFPDYFDGKLFIYDWIRGWVLNVTTDAAGDLVKIDPFMPGTRFDNPIDMKFDAEGVLYLMEYGRGWISSNVYARLNRIAYVHGNLAPQARIEADRLEGAAPLTVTFSAAGSTDADGDALTYAWRMTEGDSAPVAGVSATHTFDRPGIYHPVLTVTDPSGATGTATLTIQVGNEPPSVTLSIDGNTSFFTDGRTIRYAADATDAEDGAVPADRIVVQVDYLEQGFDRTLIEQGHRAADALSSLSIGKRFIESGDCLSCHAVDQRSVGPSYREVAARYAGQEDAEPYLVRKIIEGGGGVWGEQAMAAHPQVSEEDARAMVRYIRSLNDDAASVQRLPAKGAYALTAHRAAENPEGMYFIRAAYTDGGGEAIGPLKSQALIVLRHPKIEAERYDRGERVVVANEAIAEAYDGSYIVFEDIDLAGVTGVVYRVAAPASGTDGGRLELRLGSPEGPVVSEANVADAGSESPAELAAPVEKTTGRHDLYVVFRANADTGHPLARLDWLRLRFDVAP